MQRHARRPARCPNAPRWMLSFLAAAFSASTAAARPPNLLIFYADDLGIGDVSCWGSKNLATPSIDALARTGVRLTNYYAAAPICAPSRAALLTGRYPTRAGMSTTKNVPSAMNEPGMPTTELTIAELAKAHGYTTAILGKWHLGSTTDTQPNAQGFDLFFGHHASCIDYFSHMYYASEPFYHDLYRNRQEVFEDGQHMTELITREATRFIDQHRAQPFLLYVAYNAPHYPINPQSRFINQYNHLPRLQRDYAALVAGMDDSIGQIMAQLAKHRLTNDTLVFFSSDNGTPNESKRGEGGGSNAPYREYKRSLFEGGIHMPAILSWLGTIPENQSRAQLAIAMDLLATFAECVGAALPADRAIDGRSWMPFLKDPNAPGHETLFFEWDGQDAVRQGKWKVVRNGLIDMHLSRQNRAKGDDFVFLSDLDADPGERTNLRQRHPDLADRLLQLHDQWRASLK